MPEYSRSPKLQPAFDLLLESFDYALDTGSDRWEFAVPIRQLSKLRLGPSDLRWLVRKGYALHAREVTVPGDNGRRFQSTGDLTFCKRTCFVLTDAGVVQARSLNSDQGGIHGGNSSNGADPASHSGPAASSITQPTPVPQWDTTNRELRINGRLVKRFKWQAINQETILAAFEEEGWPARIDDPLPPHPEQDPKRRLADTIKCLNRKQAHELIHFRGDGTGEGVFWEYVPENGDGSA